MLVVVVSDSVEEDEEERFAYGTFNEQAETSQEKQVVDYAQEERI